MESTREWRRNDGVERRRSGDHEGVKKGRGVSKGKRKTQPQAEGGSGSRDIKVSERSVFRYKIH